MLSSSNRTVPGTNDRPSTWWYWVEIVLMVVSALAVLGVAACIIAVTAADPNPGGVVLAAFLGGMTVLAVVGAVSGVLGCLDDIRREARR